MGYRPAWRAPLHPPTNRAPVQSLLFLARRKEGFTAPKCQALTRSTGQPCRQPALRGAKWCKHHNGYHSAAVAEAERYGRPVIRIRNPYKRVLGTRGATERRPTGMPWRTEFNQLGPWALGRLYEAWDNRQWDATTWKYEWSRPRTRR